MTYHERRHARPHGHDADGEYADNLRRGHLLGAAWFKAATFQVTIAAARTLGGLPLRGRFF
jgi:hypothetical protein